MKRCFLSASYLCFCQHMLQLIKFLRFAAVFICLYFSAALFWLAVEVLKSICRWFIMFPETNRGFNRGGVCAYDIANGSHWRWWMPLCIVLLSEAIKFLFWSTEFQVKRKICKLCDSFMRPFFDWQRGFANWWHVSGQSVFSAEMPVGNGNLRYLKKCIKTNRINIIYL